jgi:predicted hydrocarbon binding protein
MMMTESVGMIGIALPTLRELRGATLASLASRGGGEADAVDTLREAGYAGGETVFSAFEAWLRESSADARQPENVAELTLDDFAATARRFFHDAGWGEIALTPNDDDGVLELDVRGCWECIGAEPSGTPACHITTGMLAAFFGKLAGYPVSVLETECCSVGADRCRFVMGNAEVMTWKWESLKGKLG